MDHCHARGPRPAARRALFEQSVTDHDRVARSASHHDGLGHDVSQFSISSATSVGWRAIGVHGVVGHGCVDRGALFEHVVQLAPNVAQRQGAGSGETGPPGGVDQSQFEPHDPVR